MFLKLQEKRREEGFTLIELLVVVIIIGILAAIAIPVFLNQRQRAWRSAVQSDLRNAEVAEETFYTDNGVYTADLAQLTARGYNPTDDVNVAAAVTTDGQAYCLAGNHDNNTGEVWYIGTGGTMSQTYADGCPETEAAGVTAPAP